MRSFRRNAPKRWRVLKEHLEGAKKMSANCDKWTGDTYKTEAANWMDMAALIKKTATTISDDLKSLKGVHNDAVLTATTETRTTACRVRLVMKMNPLQGQGVPATVVTWIGESVLGIKGAQGVVVPQQSVASAHFVIDPKMEAYDFLTPAFWTVEGAKKELPEYDGLEKSKRVSKVVAALEKDFVDKPNSNRNLAFLPPKPPDKSNPHPFLPCECKNKHYSALYEKESTPWVKGGCNFSASVNPEDLPWQGFP